MVPRPLKRDETKEQGAPRETAREIHFELDSKACVECPFDVDVLDDDISLAHSDENRDESTQVRDNKSKESSIRSTTAMRLRWTVIFLFCLLTMAVPLIIYFAVRDEEENEIIPLLYAFIIFGAFFAVALLAQSYDQITQRHIERISSSERAARSVVDNFYPEVVLDKTFGSQEEKESSPKMKLKNFLIDNNENDDDDNDDNPELSAKPIANLYTSCTVCFANITGFTAWSSEREPQQVFLLLETVFGILDKIAKRSRVFKVETVGDTFIAVTGLPERQADHALRMTKFAMNCLTKANRAFERLESTLGPDTGDLRLRFGLHSGPVTAGVLRGEKSRFQLFGDTVNMASHMKTLGHGNRIQLSEVTARLLIDAGKSSWIQIRGDPVEVKGKGTVKTYWVVHGGEDSSYSVGQSSSLVSSSGIGSTIGSDLAFDDFAEKEDKMATGFCDEKDLTVDYERKIFGALGVSKGAKRKRLVGWLVDLMTAHLEKIVVQRGRGSSLPAEHDPNVIVESKETVYEEVVEAFSLPNFDSKHFASLGTVKIGTEVRAQLRDFVEAISGIYHDNHFHNFEHASHVTMSAVKLLNRIVVPDDVNYQASSSDAVASDLHVYTFGINSDALAQFAVSFCCLIHDVDHRGIPNGQLSQENPEMGEKYKHKSVAEQNSVDIAWSMLMDPKYKALRQCLFTDEDDIRRFRQYVVNLVMATDIFEKDMKALRTKRWDKAFAPEGLMEESKQSDFKATIVLEHIIQAADVSHTMQHWNVYKKWNERLFQEMYSAYENGRAEKDPSLGWYGGELWFYDNYVIPLAKRLEECGVFGVSSDEGLNYALINRNEWERTGKEIVREMTDRFKKRRTLDIGGFSVDEINALSSKELANILDALIQKGRAFGSIKGTDKAGQRTAAQAWLDAMEIHERCPASTGLKDPTIIFPVFSGLVVFLKGGKVLQDKDCSFEQNLASKFVADAEDLGDPVHITRALAMLCEVQARAGQYSNALETFGEIATLYDPEKHSEGICKAYGTDRSAHAFAQSALWHYQLGDIESALKACEYVLEKLLPWMDPSNILNTSELLHPILRILKPRGEEKRLRDLFQERVVDNFEKFEIKFTPALPTFKPLLMLFDICHDPLGYSGFEKDVEWLLDGNNAIVDDFLDNILVKLAWAPNTMIAELCLLFARKLKASNGDMSKVQGLVVKGLKAARKADWKMKDENGYVTLPIAYEMHEPVMTQLQSFAERLGVVVEKEARLISEASGKESLITSLGEVRLA